MECTCAHCVNACRHRPGWGTPAEMQKIIDAGHGDKLMLDYWAADGQMGETFLLAPAVRGSEGEHAPFYPAGTCTFFNAEERCDIHPIKPRECALLSHDTSREDDRNEHFECAKMWDSDEGRALVAAWKKEHGLGEKEEPTMLDALSWMLSSAGMR